MSLFSPKVQNQLTENILLEKKKKKLASRQKADGHITKKCELLKNLFPLGSYKITQVLMWDFFLTSYLIQIWEKDN